MKTPFFDSDISCVRCGYWYSPEAFIDDEHICPSCRRKRVRAYDHTSIRIAKSALRHIFEDAPDDSSLGYIYLFVGVKTDLIKIGYASSNPLDRLSSCQVGSPDILRYLGCMYGSYAIEQRIHEVLKAYQSHGEWFNLPTEVRKVLAGRLMKTLKFD